MTRLALTLAIVEEGRLDIDRYAERTIDKAEFEGHFYADKPPGLSFLAIPAVAATQAILLATGQVVNPSRQFDLYLRVAVTSTVCVLGALAVALVYLSAVRLGASEAGALLAALALGFGTIWFGWATVFFAHVASGSLLILGLALILWLRPLFAGLALGYCIVVDLTAAPAALAIGILSFGLGWRGLARTAIGGVIGVMPLLIYNAMIFGSPLKVGYSEVVGFEGMRTGFLGLGIPSLMVLYEILFGLYRGLLPLSPILVLVPIGLVSMRQRPVAVVVAVTIASFLLINMSYVYWYGGYSTGPRHIVAMLPLACIALAFAWPRWMWARAVFLILLATSVLLSAVAASTDMFASDDEPNPIYDQLIPRVLAGEYVDMLPALVAMAAFVVIAALRLRHSRSATS
jgi:hypothetical protein